MGFSYNDWSKALHNAGFIIKERKKHMVAIKATREKVYRVTISRQGSKEVPRGLHKEMLKQAGLTEKEFDNFLKR